MQCIGILDFKKSCHYIIPLSEEYNTEKHTVVKMAAPSGCFFLIEIQLPISQNERVNRLNFTRSNNINNITTKTFHFIEQKDKTIKQILIDFF